MNKRIIDALNSRSKKTPIWLMRQAGRYLPEYKIIREKAGSFLKLCYSPQSAAEVTLQPIRRFGFDGAIIFSDILVIPHSLGLNLDFIQNEGPKLERITNDSELKKLKISNRNWQFENVWNTVSKVKNELPKDKTLIGFAGAPWTVATYILEGKGKTEFEFSKNAVKNDVKFASLGPPKYFTKLFSESTVVTSPTGPHWKAPANAPAEVATEGTIAVKSFSCTSTPGES
jgi:uroporphyrinogen decarboxylase